MFMEPTTLCMFSHTSYHIPVVREDSATRITGSKRDTQHEATGRHSHAGPAASPPPRNRHHTPRAGMGLVHLQDVCHLCSIRVLESVSNSSRLGM
ncbi:hypothetical protein E2C01_030099 [Portunus trituberculatus]|uniref:Uncharacterized protein n=1 Tax=Portunus trituberculatus TaxID=210409 RepID=A0A5B7EUT5_PORTR|nr:hypothetical protein [Portunus trituberculatus]